MTEGSRIRPTNKMHASTGMFSEVDLMPPPREFIKVKLPTHHYFENLDKQQALDLFEKLYIAIALKWGSEEIKL